MFLECPYCNSQNVAELNGYPYPYERRDKKDNLLQKIKKHKCECNETFFSEIRSGLDMGLKEGMNPKLYFQTYKQGMYKFKDTSIVYKGE